MSTSPSWFDQEKFSRLVKKVGPKPITEVLPSVLGSETEARPYGEGLASTARISLVSKPSSLLAEQRALPALPRRTAPLPSLKSLFPAPAAQPPSAPAPAPAESPSPSEQAKEGSGEPAPTEPAAPATEEETGDLTEIWHKMSLLNEELAHTVLERDQALHDAANFREQLRRAVERREETSGAPTLEELTKVAGERDAAVAQTQSLRLQVLQSKEASSASNEESAKLTKERDDALAEGQNLRAQLLEAKEAVSEKEAAASSQTQEVAVLTQERDQARHEYADLRKQYEALKAEQSPKEETLKFRKEWEQQLEELKGKIEERDKEIAALKAKAETTGNGDEKLKQEAASLREQLAKAKEEASIAQRGLALSQMALQQTRDTLREATEGTSLSRHNFDNLKNECAILAQQNTVLQAQVDSLSRDLSSSNKKITTRLQH